MVSVADNTPANDQLVQRLAAIPLIHDALNKVVSSYETTKHFNPLIESTLTRVEQNVHYATEKAKPVYEQYLQESVAVASKAACKGLDHIEESYPAVKMTPDELHQKSHDYYEKSYMKQGMDTVVATRDYGMQKVGQTHAYYQQVLTSLFGYGASVLSGSLDYCDEMIEKYVAEGTTQEQTPKDGPDSYVTRVHTMSGKMASGLTVKAERQATNAKVAIQKAVADFRGAMDLVDYVKSTRNWAGQSTSHLMGNVSVLKDNLEKQAKQYNIKPEVLLLRWVKLSSGMLSSASEQILKHTANFFPETAKNSLEAASAYFYQLDQSLAEAKSLSDVKNELINEVKENLTTIEQGLVNVLERFPDYPPFSWMHSKLNSSLAKPEETERKSEANPTTN